MSHAEVWFESRFLKDAHEKRYYNFEIILPQSKCHLRFVTVKIKSVLIPSADNLIYHQNNLILFPSKNTNAVAATAEVLQEFRHL